MDNSMQQIVNWATLRVTYLDKLQNYKDAYAVSQEFCEWTTSLSISDRAFKAAILKIPNLNKENRTS